MTGARRTIRLFCTPRLINGYSAVFFLTSEEEWTQLSDMNSLRADEELVLLMGMAVPVRRNVNPPSKFFNTSQPIQT